MQGGDSLKFMAGHMTYELETGSYAMNFLKSWKIIFEMFNINLLKLYIL